jgi:hypothetical protein
MIKFRRIKSCNMRPEEMLMVMGGNHEGAMHVCRLLVLHTRRIDPRLHESTWALLQLDALLIHDARIWKFFNDVCRGHVGRMVAVLRAHQLTGYGVSEEKLKYAIDHHGAGLDVESIVEKLKNSSPSFQPESVSVAVGV